jgi:3-phenylpropionate/cinnamic acid dioxygenase small subunit
MADLTQMQQLLARYCFAHDSQDPEALALCFAKDVALLGLEGRDAVVARYAEGYKHLTARRRHVLTNFIVLEDGEEDAIVQSYITLYLIRDDKLELHLIGVYRDHLVIEDGEWKIKSREATMDVPYQPGVVPSAPAATYPSSEQAGPAEARA